MNMMIHFEYILADAGWADAIVSSGTNKIEMTVSYLHDTLKQLGESMLSILNGEKEATTIFMDEPGEHHMILRRQSDEHVEVEVRWYEDWASWKMYPSDKYQTLLKENESIQILAKEIINAMDKIYQEQGMKGYKEKWGEHDFPKKEYNELKTRLR
jgi:hypothetical protein